MRSKLLFVNLIIFSLLLFLASTALAATVSCRFRFGEEYSIEDGAQAGVVSRKDIRDLFGRGIKLDVSATLLAKLDSKVPFLAGEIEQGTVYLQGGRGIDGRLSRIEYEQMGNGKIVIYRGMCSVIFGD